MLFRDDNARESGSSQPTAGNPVHPSVPRPAFNPLVSENREHLGDSPSFSSDFQAPSPLAAIFFPVSFSPPPLLCLPLAVHPFALALIPRLQDVQHRRWYRRSRGLISAFSSSTLPTLPRSPYPFPASSVNGFHRRGPHSLGRSSPFLPLFSPSPFCLSFDPRIYPSSCSPLCFSVLRWGWPTGWLFA